MKYKDIKQLPKSYYNITIHLSQLKNKLNSWKSDQEEMGYKFELNPDFQRGHIWTKEQQIKYIEYILIGGEEGKTIMFNHPEWNNDYREDMVCIDGLQRLTAILKFLDNELPVFDGNYINDFEDKRFMLRGLYINFSVLCLPRLEVLKYYKSMNSGGTVHTQEDLNKVDKLIELENKVQK